MIFTYKKQVDFLILILDQRKQGFYLTIFINQHNGLLLDL